jgi:hypothetical protein
MSAEIHPTPSRTATSSNDFWKHKSAEELAAEQGVKPWTSETWAKLQELADELWPTEKDADEFAACVRQTRSEGNQPKDQP